LDEIRKRIDHGGPVLNTPDEHEKATNAAVQFVRAHPVVSTIFATCIVAGAIIGAVYLTPDWSLARRLAAGAVAGAGVALLTTASKMIG
jgi:hypothetical protein